MTSQHKKEVFFSFPMFLKQKRKKKQKKKEILTKFSELPNFSLVLRGTMGFKIDLKCVRDFY